MKTLPLPSFLFADLIALHGPALGPLLLNRDRLAGMLPTDWQKLVPSGDEKQRTIAEYVAPFVNQRRASQKVGNIADIHVNDALSHNTTEMDRAFGMTDYAQLIGDLAAAAADPEIAGIHLDINSPGGSAVGAPEAAAAVAAARMQKPVAAHVGVMAASAAYYLASACNVITASPSAIVGSIGTICTFMDFAGMLAKVGITPHIITPEASDLKATGNQLRAPTKAESAFMQQRVERLNAAFTGWVQSHRGCAPDAMRGQWFTGNEAVANGLADYTGTISDSLASLRSLIGD